MPLRRHRLLAAALAALLSLGAVACEAQPEEGDVGAPEDGALGDEMGDPGEAGGEVPADTGEGDV